MTAIGNGIRRRLIRKGVPAEKIGVLPNWINADEIVPMSRCNGLRLEWQIPENKFVVLYAGTFGRIHDTLQLLEAARALENDDVAFLFVGQGYDFERLSKQTETEGLSNVWVRPFVPRSQICKMQSLSDVSIAKVRRGFGHTSVPSKVLGYMSAGRPVIAMVDADCDTADLVRTADCGTVIEPDNVTALVREVRDLRRVHGKLHEWGQNARKHVVTRLSSQAILPEGVRLLEDVAQVSAL